MAWDGIRARKFPRVNYKCRIRVQKNGKEEIVDTHTENMGQGGICVSLAEDLGIFADVTLEMFIGEEKYMIQSGGKIVWVVKGHPAGKEEEVKYDTGIEFTDIRKEDLEKIEQLVREKKNPILDIGKVA